MFILTRLNKIDKEFHERLQRFKQIEAELHQIRHDLEGDDADKKSGT
jgi:hypothetical protein